MTLTNGGGASLGASTGLWEAGLAGALALLTGGLLILTSRRRRSVQ